MGANGQTGRAIMKALMYKGEEVRAFVSKTEQIEELKSLGVKEVMVGDMMNQADVNRSYVGVSAVYHICSVFNPNEVEIGKIALNAAKSAKIQHFVYHSVLHSIIHDMPHHQKKHMVEELLVNSQIPYTIIQPSAFMQNILESRKTLREEGIFRQKLFTSSDTRICMIDLEDLADAVSKILTNREHIGATYELCGPDNLSLLDIKSIIEKHYGHEIIVETPEDEVMAAGLKEADLGEYYINSLLKMFHHYNEQGFIGNSNTLTWILGRKPNDFSSFIKGNL
jgi:uncharacterized protein YbjT (DUF2867 family)